MNVIMSKRGFVTKVKSNGKEYFYLRKSYRLAEQVIKKNIIAFGDKEKALSKMDSWIKDYNDFPAEYKKMGYDQQDIKKWIEEIKSK
jgi:DNA-binding transcriptional regulator YhcF (GntR family)